MSVPELPGPEYPNSPLVGVVFEIRFSGEPVIECHRDEFFEEARAEFPTVLVPKVPAGSATALSPYQFQRADGTATLLTAMNLFAFRTAAYPGFPAFRTEALRWIGAFANRFRIGKLTRTGLRYTNLIPYPASEGSGVSSFLDVSLRLGPLQSSKIAQVSLSAVIPVGPNGALTVQIRESSPEDGGQTIILDFDFAMTGDLHVSRVEQYLDDSHTETKRLFEGLLTDNYRKYLRGDGVT